MAATIARARGFTKNGDSRTGEATRLGAGSARASANTWRTFATAYINADGSGYVEVRRNGTMLHTFDFGKE